MFLNGLIIPSKDNYILEEAGLCSENTQTWKQCIIILLISSFYIMGNIHLFTIFFLSTHNLGKEAYEIPLHKAIKMFPTPPSEGFQMNLFFQTKIIFKNYIGNSDMLVIYIPVI